MSPDEEKEELSLIYQAKGIPSEQAEELAERIISNPETAIDTLAREELGLDPSALGSPWTAAFSSFICICCRRHDPVIPYFPVHRASGGSIASAGVCGHLLYLLSAR